MKNLFKKFKIYLKEDLPLDLKYSFIGRSIDWFRYDLKIGIKNFFKFRKIIWRDRWWDFGYILSFLEFKLKDMEENWVVNTHYIGDKKHKKILKIMIEHLIRMRKIERYDDSYDKLNFKEQERLYQYHEEQFFKLFTKHYRRLWD